MKLIKMFLISTLTLGTSFSFAKETAKEKPVMTMEKYKQKEMRQHFNDIRELRIDSASFFPAPALREVSLSGVNTVSEVRPLGLAKFMDSEQLADKIKERKQN